MPPAELPDSSDIDTLSPDLKDFFYRHFDSKTYAEMRTQLIWRLQFLMTNPIIRQMFSALKTKLDIGNEMDAGKIILIDNSKQKLGDEGAEFFGRFFIALVLAAAQQRAGRPQSEKLPCYFYIDECQNVIRRDEKISTILDECRSQKIAMIMAHQRSAQITSPNCSMPLRTAPSAWPTVTTRPSTLPTSSAHPLTSCAAYTSSSLLFALPIKRRRSTLATSTLMTELKC